MGLGQAFNNLSFKHMTAVREKIQSVADYFSNYCFWQHAILSKDDCND